MDVIAGEPVRQLLKKTSISVDEGLEKDFPLGYATIVGVTLKDGRTFSEFTPHCKGDPENPVALAEMKDRFIAMSTGIISGDNQANILRMIENLEELDDVNALVACLR
jgi:2-methylcitrate dehydratase PrpD